MQIFPQRISIVGTTGTGKTTLAKRLSICLGIPHFELDGIHWGANWEPLPTEKFQTRVSKILGGDTWVIDGNYSKVRDIVFVRADTVIWLDYGIARILYQLFQRTIHRVFTKENLWNGNHENFSSQFLSRDSIFLWAIKTYPKRKKMYPALFAKPDYSHLKIVKFSTPKEMNIWVKKIEADYLSNATLSPRYRRTL